MWFRIVGRLLTCLGLAWAKMTAILVALHVLPGPIQDVLAGGLDHQGLREAIAAGWGPERCLLRQYLDFLFRIFRDDFGVSDTPAMDAVGSQLLPTVELAFTAGLLAVLFSGALALLMVGRGRQAVRIAPVLEMAFGSAPLLWLGMLLLLAFAFDLNWFGSSGGASGWTFILPSVALALPTTGLIMHALREAVQLSPEPESIQTVPPIGVGHFIRRARHVLRQDLLPIVMLGGWLVGGLFGGSLLEPMMFGSVELGPTLRHDIPAVLTVVLLACFVHVATSTLLDSMDVVVDPRLREL